MTTIYNPAEKKTNNTPIKVVGVTFTNEDGTNRQNIIKALCGSHGIVTVDLVETVYHNPDTNEDERAIKVCDHNTKLCLGYIARTQLEDARLADQMTAFIRCYKGTWNVQLDGIKRPSAKQYAYAKAIALKSGTAIPAYDVRALAYLFDMDK